MADLQFTSELDAKGVVTGANSINRSLNQLNKSTTQSGRGFLAFSQGVEDFSMAGLKGVLNNIPQAIQGFGGSAGLQGAASLAAVGMYVLNEQLWKYLDNLQEVKLATLALPDFIDASGFKAGEEATKKATTAFANYVSVVEKSRADQNAQMTTNIGFFGDLSGSSRKLKEQQDILAVTQSLASESEKAAQIKAISDKAEIDAMNEKVALSEVAANQVAEIANGQKTAAQSSKAQMESDAASLEKLVSGLPEKINAINEKFQKDRSDLIKNERVHVVEEQSIFGNYMRPETQVEKQARYQRNVAGLEREKLAAIKDAQKLAQPDIEAASTKLAWSKEQLRVMEETAAASEKDRVAKEEALSVLRAKVEMDKESLKIASDIKAAEENAKNAKLIMENKAKQGITSDGLLSSIGRIGGAAREGVVALNAITLQKNQLTALKQIEKNTRSSRGAVYN
jgi:hypothetical protein